jgi:hypothetical protein
MSAGCTIHGKHRFSARTNSTGICFLGEVTIVGDYTLSPTDCYIFLDGIVSEDILVEFETEINLKETYGAYNHLYGGRLIIPEYCIPEYDMDSMHPTRYCIPDEWKWYQFN